MAARGPDVLAGSGDPCARVRCWQRCSRSARSASCCSRRPCGPRCNARSERGTFGRCRRSCRPVAWDEDLLAGPVLLTDRELLGTGEPVPVYRARRAGQTEAVLFVVTAPQGYGGEIRLLVAVDAQGRVLGVRALAHRETDGLGDMIETRRSDWIERFKGRSVVDPPLTRWAIGAEGGDFDAWTGATVTSRAMVAAVRDALRLVERHRAELFGEPPEAVLLPAYAGLVLARILELRRPELHGLDVVQRPRDLRRGGGLSRSRLGGSECTALQQGAMAVSAISVCCVFMDRPPCSASLRVVDDLVRQPARSRFQHRLDAWIDACRVSEQLVVLNLRLVGDVEGLFLRPVLVRDRIGSSRRLRTRRTRPSSGSTNRRCETRMSRGRAPGRSRRCLAPDPRRPRSRRATSPFSASVSVIVLMNTSRHACCATYG